MSLVGITLENKRLEWDMDNTEFQHAQFTRLPRKNALMIDLREHDVSFVVTRTFGEKIGFYLGVYLDRIEGLSKETTGVMGNIYNQYR